jgi:hypothetical protein
MTQRQHAFASWQPQLRDGLTVVGRRSVLKAGLAGMAGLSMPGILAANEASGGSKHKSIILLWMTGGPSHLDTLDPKPLAPVEMRGPFGTIPTVLPGVHVCEHLPKYAKALDRMTLIRSIDCRFSSHEPNHVFQTANLAAEPRTNPEAPMYPALASLAAKHHGTIGGQMPPYVVLNMESTSHIAWSGYLGKAYDPFNGRSVGKAFSLPGGLTTERLVDRRALNQQLDRLRRDLDISGNLEGVDRFGQQALDMVLGQKARNAFDVSQESQETLDRYGNDEWCKQTLLARRLVEAGVGFVTLDLSRPGHSGSGTWDTHGDKFPPYGGIESGLKPLLPVFDHLLTTLIDDLTERGLSENVLVIAMGEFGRAPRMGTQGSSDGRDHWPVVMSATLACGGLKHGQVIGASDRTGSEIANRPITPGDMASTIFRHLGVPLDLQYVDNRGRPRIVIENGQPISELYG